jgi:site-specific recombinase XerD
MKHPLDVVPNDVVLWRDRLRSQKKSAATVAFKLSVIRSFFEYLKAAGAVPLNPASTKLVSPPELPSEPSGRALSAKNQSCDLPRRKNHGRPKPGYLILATPPDHGTAP